MFGRNGAMAAGGRYACLERIGYDGAVEDTDGWYGIGAFAFSKG